MTTTKLALAFVLLAAAPAASASKPPFTSDAFAKTYCALMVKNYHHQFSCRVEPQYRMINLTDHAMIDAMAAATVGSAMNNVPCNTMKANMLGHVFARGWRFNYMTHSGVVIASCKLY